jgi:hypothetical protein
MARGLGALAVVGEEEEGEEGEVEEGPPEEGGFCDCDYKK